MCKLCAIAARYSRPRQDSLIFDLSQFAVAATANPLTQQSHTQQTQKQSEQQVKSHVTES
ncbi:hypothetical protein H6F88_25845 [Oculatella sp. FACHB-28]|uniref:hypothetical protein n=1 Tax=Cyanophyceae TaxID=3028117 RepID=UPI0016881C09|nr:MULTISPECIES: hypothetical protein [Cyanophyceae]MBD1867935.1 hypothetical protein [Cyanobacteria bacterium FACHB-471]MBD2059380.1 hypothetical protein [Oculatella sp. FACHB-28]MBD2068685.1 hypothetical protein [Leptolyngbya sp. FACHB-671]